MKIKTILLTSLCLAFISVFGQGFPKRMGTTIDELSVEMTVEADTSKFFFKTRVKNLTNDVLIYKAKPYIAHYLFSSTQTDSLNHTLFFNMSDTRLVDDVRHRHDLDFVVRRLGPGKEIILEDTFDRYYIVGDIDRQTKISFNSLLAEFSLIRESELSLEDFQLPEAEKKFMMAENSKQKDKIKPQLLKMGAIKKHGRKGRKVSFSMIL